LSSEAISQQIISLYNSVKGLHKISVSIPEPA